MNKNSTFFGFTIVVFIQLCFSLNAYSQYIKHYVGHEHLSTRQVVDGLQDSKGFLWFATTDGLNRFDGYNFINFSTTTLQGLLSNDITALYEDTKGNLWIGTKDKGVCVLDLKTYQIILDKNIKTPSVTIVDIEEDKFNNIWISTEEGLLYKHSKNQQFSLVTNNKKEKGNFGEHPRLVSDENYLYLYTLKEGVFKLDIISNQLVSNFGQELHPHHGYVTKIEGTGLVFCAKEGVMKIEQDTFRSVFEIAGPETYMVIKDYQKNYWFVQHDRKQIHFLSNGKINNLTSLIFKKEDNVHVSKIFEDSFRNIWICTTNGIYKITNNHVLFSSVLRADQWKSDNYIPSFRGMLEDKDGTIYFGGYSGLFKYKLDGEIVQLFDNKIPYTPYVLINKDENELWVLCEGYGIIAVNKTTGKIKQYKDNNSKTKKYKGIYLSSGILAADGNFWLGSYTGIIRFNPTTETYYKQTIKFENYDLTNRVPNQFIQTSNGNIWICTNEGVIVLDKYNKPKEHYHVNGLGKFKIPFNDVNCVFEDNQKRIWFGSRTKGVFVLGKNEQFELSINHRLADNSVTAILEDDNQNLWISTNKGLSKYNYRTKEVSSYFIENGLSSNEFNKGSFLKSKNGLLFFGGVNGINICNTHEDINKTSISKLTIAKAEIPDLNGNDKVYYNDNEFSKGITLAHDMAYLYLEFTINDYTRSEKNTYEYYLEGISINWQPLNNKNYIRLAAIAPGNYKLVVRGADSNGNSIKNQLFIPIKVLQVFYKTWWFILLNFILITSIAGYIIYLRFKRLKIVSDMRIKIASDLHDEVGSTLTKIAMQAEILEEDVDETHKSMLNNISVGSRGAMSALRDMVWSIDSRSNDVGSLYDKINEYAQQMLEESGFNYYVHLDESLKDQYLTPLQKKEIFYIVKESVNNVLKHGERKYVKIEIYQKEHTFVLSIYNSTDKKIMQKVTGSGLKNIEMRAKRIGATISVNHENGFTVLMKMPLKTNFFNFNKT